MLWSTRGFRRRIGVGLCIIVIIKEKEIIVTTLSTLNIYILILTSLSPLTCFVPSFSYDLTYYLLGYLGVVPYTFGSVEQRIGVLFACVNNFANPIVYVTMMEKYRLVTEGYVMI